MRRLCKASTRAYQHLGESGVSGLSQCRVDLAVQVKSIEEEEFCAIPMGGVLPRVPQKVIGVGGTAGMVHPSTGELQSLTVCSSW